MIIKKTKQLKSPRKQRKKQTMIAMKNLIKFQLLKGKKQKS
jgi:hypothetical protein